MSNSNLEKEISTEMEAVISQSCADQELIPEFRNLHIAILKKHYNATDVSIDYHRKRIEMDVIMDDGVYDPNVVNLCVPTFRTNLLFRNLCDFLNSCLDRDHKSLAFYAGLLRSLRNREVQMSLA